jgi:hypothetical protein
MADSVLLNVFSAESMSTFDGRDYEAILVVVPSKNLGLGDIDRVKAIVSRLMSAFRSSSVVCFEANSSPGGECEWRSFTGL